LNIRVLINDIGVRPSYWWNPFDLVPKVKQGRLTAWC